MPAKKKSAQGKAGQGSGMHSLLMTVSNPISPTVEIVSALPPARLKSKRHRSPSEELLKLLLYGEAKRDAGKKLRHDLGRQDAARKIMDQLKHITVRPANHASDLAVKERESVLRPSSKIKLDSGAPLLEPRAICLVDPEQHKCRHAVVNSRGSLLDTLMSSSETQLDDSATALRTEQAVEGSALNFVNLYAFAADPAAMLSSFAGQQGAFDALAKVANLMPNEKILSAPEDRMTIFIYWFGWELAVPHSDLQHLKKVHSASNYVFSFLQAVAVAGGVPEMLPFIRYVSLYCEFEFSAIEAQDQGHGVILSATWVLPIAIVPRPWDYPESLKIPDSTEQQILNDIAGQRSPMQEQFHTAQTPPIAI